MWGNGGELWDPTTYTAEGYVNSPEAVAALQFMRDMVADDKSVDPASANWTINERLAALVARQDGDGLNWVPLFGGIADDPASSPFVGKFGYAPVPEGPQSQARHVSAARAPVSTPSRSRRKPPGSTCSGWHPRKRNRRWWRTRRRLHFGRTGSADAAQYPWQQALLELIPIVRDIWNIPEYAPLLHVSADRAEPRPTSAARPPTRPSTTPRWPSRRSTTRARTSRAAQGAGYVVRRRGCRLAEGVAAALRLQGRRLRLQEDRSTTNDRFVLLHPLSARSRLAPPETKSTLPRNRRTDVRSCSRSDSSRRR